jgi:hypothetical protein
VATISVGCLVLMVLLPVVLSTDVFGYAMYGRILAIHHANPYISVPASFPHDPFLRYMTPAWRTVPSAYWPAQVLLGALVAIVARTPAHAVVAFKLLSGISGIAALLVLRRLVRRMAPEREAFGMVLFGWSPILLVHAVAAGHVDPLLALALLGALSLVCAAWDELANARRALRLELTATAMLTGVVLLKATLAPPLLLLVVAATARRPAGTKLRRLWAHAGVILVLLVIIAGPFVRASDLTLGLAKAAAYRSFLAPSGLWSTTIGALISPSQAQGGGTAALVVRIAFPLVFAGCLVLLGWRLIRDGAAVDAGRLGADWAVAMLVLLLASPILFPWYLLWLLPIAWLLPLPGVASVATVATTAFASISEIVPRTGPGLWRSLVTTERYVFAPMLTLILAWVVVDLLEQRARQAVRSGVGADALPSTGGTAGDS